MARIARSVIIFLNWNQFLKEGHYFITEEVQLFSNQNLSRTPKIVPTENFKWPDFGDFFKMMFESFIQLHAFFISTSNIHLSLRLPKICLFWTIDDPNQLNYFQTSSR